MKSNFKRGLILFFIIGTYWAVLQDKIVSAYFRKAGTILEILAFTVVGAFIYAFVAYKVNLKNKDD
jgi:hypothetical protein